jgi:GMP synthase-like glutamine amidotransferase
LRVAVLETGAPPPRLRAGFGSYGDMFRRLLGPAFAIDLYDVRAGRLPEALAPDTALLITGSSSGVYDPEDWIGALAAFLRAEAGARPIVGICFGHQILAEAMGGKARKSDKGWGIGLHGYEVTRRASYMDDVAGFSLPVSHQDQVTELGERARVLAGNAFTPFGMVDYPGLRAMSLQAHPEFEPEFARALVESRRGDRFTDEAAEAARSALLQPNDRTRVEVWMRRFLHSA